MTSLKLLALTLLITLVAVVGCGRSQPKAIENASVTIEGKPNQKVYLSINASVVKVEGSSTSTQGMGNYGVQTLDENGQLAVSVNEMIKPKPLHGFIVTMVSLDDEPLTLTVKADGMKEKVDSVEGKLEYSDMQFGYQPKREKGSPMAHDPEDSVYEANEYLKRMATEPAKAKQPAKSK